MVGSQAQWCAATGALSGTDDCITWGGHGFIPASIDMAAFNAAVQALTGAETAMMTAACAVVATTNSAGCQNHQFGHLCAQVDSAGR